MNKIILVNTILVNKQSDDQTVEIDTDCQYICQRNYEYIELIKDTEFDNIETERKHKEADMQAVKFCCK